MDKQKTKNFLSLGSLRSLSPGNRTRRADSGDPP